MTDDIPTCAYASDEQGALGAEGEDTLDNGVLICRSEAEMVVRPKSGLHQRDYGKKVPMCRRHGEFCAGSAQADWDILHLNIEDVPGQLMEIVRGNGGDHD